MDEFDTPPAKTVEEVMLTQSATLPQGRPEDILVFWQVAAVCEDLFMDTLQYLVDEGAEAWTAAHDAAEVGPAPDYYSHGGPQRAAAMKGILSVWADEYSDIEVEDLYPTDAPKDGRRRDLMEPERTEVQVARVVGDMPTDVSIPEMARTMGIPREAVQRAFDELLDAGFLRRTREVCHTEMYDLTADGRQ